MAQGSLKTRAGKSSPILYSRVRFLGVLRLDDGCDFPICDKEFINARRWPQPANHKRWVRERPMIQPQCNHVRRQIGRADARMAASVGASSTFSSPAATATRPPDGRLHGSRPAATPPSPQTRFRCPVTAAPQRNPATKKRASIPPSGVDR